MVTSELHPTGRQATGCGPTISGGTASGKVLGHVLMCPSLPALGRCGEMKGCWGGEGGGAA